MKSSAGDAGLEAVCSGVAAEDDEDDADVAA